MFQISFEKFQEVGGICLPILPLATQMTLTLNNFEAKKAKKGLIL
jgi:hypothetical protein